MDMTQAMSIKYANMPQSLFKYRKLDQHSLELLQTDKVWLSVPSDFNDPFDCGLSLTIEKLGNKYFSQNADGLILIKMIPGGFGLSSTDISRLRASEDPFNEIIVIVMERHPGAFPEGFLESVAHLRETKFGEMLSWFNRTVRNTMLTASFSEDNRSILMWSHYADGHRGFCVEYDFKQLGSEDPRTQYLYPVIYADAVFDASSHLGFDPDTMNYLVGTYAALNKSSEWRYEKEWRYVYPMTSSDQLRFLQAPKPAAIYLGARIAERDRSLIREIALDRGIEIRNMSMKPAEFTLTIM